MRKKILILIIIALPIFAIFSFVKIRKLFVYEKPKTDVEDLDPSQLITLEDTEQKGSLLDMLVGTTKKAKKQKEDKDSKTCATDKDCSWGAKCYGIPGGAAFCRKTEPTCAEFCGEKTCHLEEGDPTRLVCD